MVCGADQAGRPGVIRMHKPGREWKRWRVRGSRCSASQWMGLDDRHREWAST